MPRHVPPEVDLFEEALGAACALGQLFDLVALRVFQHHLLVVSDIAVAVGAPEAVLLDELRCPR